MKVTEDVRQLFMDARDQAGEKYKSEINAQRDIKNPDEAVCQQSNPAGAYFIRTIITI